MDQIDGIPVPTPADIAATRAALAPFIAETPVLWRDDLPGLEDIAACFKFELLQHSGTFKARGAFANLLALDAAQRARGVTAISAGNHAVAVAYAAMRLGMSAKVVMIKTASPARVALVHRYGAELLLAEDGASGFEMVRRIEAEEGRYFVHPFNGLRTVLGTATLGAEWAGQAAGPDARGLDAVVLPVGGGGLAAGAATALRLANPALEIWGVEPEGADGMAQSFRAEAPVKLAALSGIADSLMAPHTEAYSYGLCRRALAGLVTVSDEQLRAAMALLFAGLKLAVEPACAAATAAALFPLRSLLAGKRVGLLLCGSNTDMATFTRHVPTA